jgi:indolepyruvate ferredoxin oxidoreductase
MITEYLDAVGRLVGAYRPESSAEAVAIASLPDSVRGYEHLKLRRAAAYRTELTTRLTQFEALARAGHDSPDR